MPVPILTDDELKAILAADLDSLRAQNRFWFWIRSSIILVYIALMVTGLLFFPDALFAKFQLPTEWPAGVMQDYIALRVTTVVGCTALYLFSYGRDWYFSYVALAAVLIAIGNLINDFFTLYIFVKPDALLTIQAIIGFRLVIIVLLIMNFLGARHELRRIG